MVQAAIDKCRICGGSLYDEPLLQYRNMPGAAQFMPDEAALATERGADLDVCQCSSCGLVQLNMAPVPYYREVVRAAAFSGDMRKYRLEQFREFAKAHGLVGRKVIEIGCGKGEYVSVLNDAGMQANGLEHSAASVQACREAGIMAFEGFMETGEEKIPEAPYAAFYILNFLEHLPHPVASLRGIASNLEEGGIGMVEVPNFDMIIKKGLFSEFIGDHLFYFTEATIRQLLSTSGFDVIDCRPVWQDYILSATVRKKSSTDLGYFLAYQKKITEDVGAFMVRFAPGAVAVWGAGHQALAIISLLELGEKIAYVVDSAPFKQGKFTPASHVPIVAPDTLHSRPVDAVIVMAASYSDEVARILRQKYDPNLKIAILRDYGLEMA